MEIAENVRRPPFEGENAMATLFEKYGGFGPISRVVIDFYGRLSESDEVGSFFENIDMPRLIDHQTKFVASLLGGPASFSDARLANVHQPLRIKHRHFDAIAQVLDETLQEHGFTAQDREAVLTAVEARRQAIVERAS